MEEEEPCVNCHRRNMESFVLVKNSVMDTEPPPSSLETGVAAPICNWCTSGLHQSGREWDATALRHTNSAHNGHVASQISGAHYAGTRGRGSWAGRGRRGWGGRGRRECAGRGGGGGKGRQEGPERHSTMQVASLLLFSRV